MGTSLRCAQKSGRGNGVCQNTITHHRARERTIGRAGDGAEGFIIGDLVQTIHPLTVGGGKSDRLILKGWKLEIAPMITGMFPN